MNTNINDFLGETKERNKENINEEGELVMNNQNIAEVLNVPYSKEFLVKEVRECLTPLLKKEDVAKKWSPAIYDIIKMSEGGITYINEILENELFVKMNEKTYIRLLKTINNNSILLVGKMLLKKEIDFNEIDKHISLITTKLYYMYETGRRTSSWIYDETDEYNSYDYAELFDIIMYTEIQLKKICDKYQEMKLKKFDLNTLDGEEKIYISHVKLVYEKLLNFGAKVLELEGGNRLYAYKDILKESIRILGKKLFFTTGEYYMNIDNRFRIVSKTKTIIEKSFKKLEKGLLVPYRTNLEFTFEKLENEKDYGDENDYEVLNAYKELKDNACKLFRVF